mmetsp:Transcript_23240/g.46347  ORF Transcript_23240/g.46347 Transcript_23240/m.46347 type:complete len:95 (+) Transcript_23240:435-719(+)
MKKQQLVVMQLRFIISQLMSGMRKDQRAMKRWFIAANLGCNLSLKQLKNICDEGKMSKEDFAAALRSHLAAVDAMKSPEITAARGMKEYGHVKD